MPRYKITLMYDGTNFAGFQRQPDRRTVESVLTQVINKMAKNPNPKILVYGSGRTDAGVHALAQVVHFDFPFAIPEESMRKGLNSMLPMDMEIRRVEIVPDTFHARYDVSGKRYLYRMDMGEFRNPFKRNYTGHWKFPVDLDKINQALEDVATKDTGEIPMHIRNAPIEKMKELGYNEGYLYPHDFPGHKVEQQYLPDKMLGTKYYNPD